MLQRKSTLDILKCSKTRLHRCMKRVEDDAGLDLVAAAGVVELAQGSQVAVRHVCTAAEENQSAGAAGEGPPEHLDAVLFLEGRRCV